MSVITLNVFAQDQSLFDKEIHITKTGDTLPYRIMYPKDYNPNKKYPVVLFLHGAGERGNDNQAQLNYVDKLFEETENRDSFPAIIVVPQCPKESFWSNVKFEYKDGKREFLFDVTQAPSKAMESLISLLENDILKRKVDSKKIYVMGLSMGGMGTFEIVYRKPNLFAAAVAICGGGDTKSAPQLTQPAWRIYHGDQDDVVPDFLSKEMQEAITAAGGHSELTIYAGVNHGSWHNVFAEPDLLKWMFSQKKKR